MTASGSLTADAARSGNPITGGLPYAGDVRLAGMLHAAFVAAAEPHARIVNVDVSAARAMAGVEVVLTGADLAPATAPLDAPEQPGREVPRFGRALADYPVLAHERVLFAGQRVAAVAAVDEATARAAARLVEVTLEPLPAVLDPAEALATDAPVLHPGYDGYINARPDRAHPNEQGVEHVEAGDPTTAWDACDETHEHTFAWGRSVSGPLETLTCLVSVADERIDVWAAHKEPFSLRRHLSQVGGIAEDRVVVHPVSIGGDFGGKGAPLIESICLFLSQAAGKPVRARLAWDEVLCGTHTRHAGAMRLRTGLRAGELHVHEADAQLDGGAFAALKPRPTHVVSMSAAFTPYAPPHRRLDAVTVYTNTVPGGHVRSPGTFQAVFAGESHIDMIARARREDPVDFRRRVASHSQARTVLAALGEVTVDWPRRSAGRRTDTDASDAGRDTDWPATPSTVDAGLLRGVGVAVFSHGYGTGDTTTRAVATSAAVEIEVGTPEQGAGNRRAFRRLAAGVLSVPEERIVIRQADTSSELPDRGVGASRVTAVAGRAIAEACRELLAVLGHGHAEAGNRLRGDQGRYWIADQLRALKRDKVTATARWMVDPRAAEASPLAYAALAIEVTVDVTTGVVVPVRAAMVVDAGPVVDPVAHRGQLEGGFVFGLSQALHEDAVVTDGRVEVRSLREYGIAAASHVPPLRIDLIEATGLQHDALDELRSVGELANLGPAPAIANAVHDATGARVTTLPLTPERVWRALHANQRTPH